MEKEEIINSVLDNFERKGMNCAESILSAFLEHFNMDKKLTRIATPFGGGICGQRDLCGILIGGLMVIGLCKGRVDWKGSKKESYILGAGYYRWFKKNFQLRCCEILPGPFKGHTEKCSKLMEKAVIYLFDILNN